MGYGTYGEDNEGSGFGGSGGGSYPSMGATYGSGSNRIGGADTTPVSGRGSTGGGYNFADALGPALQSGSQIMDRINGSRQATLQAGANIPVDPQYMKPTIDDMALQIALLRHAQLSGRDQQVASVSGSRAAQSRGLTGPIAAALQSESINQAQQGYNKWRMGQLTAMQPQYLALLGQYQAGLKAQSDAKYKHQIAMSNEANQGQNIGQGVGSVLDLIAGLYGVKTNGLIGVAGGAAGNAIGGQAQQSDLRLIENLRAQRERENTGSTVDPYSF